MKLFRLFLFLTLFTQACQAQLSKNEAEKMIIGVWQAVPYPKPPQDDMDKLAYQELLSYLSPIVEFTPEKTFRRFNEKLEWKFEQDVQFFTFISKDLDTSRTFRVKELNKDTLWLVDEALKEEFVFSSKIIQYNTPLLIILPPPNRKDIFDKRFWKPKNTLKIVVNDKSEIYLNNKKISLEIVREKVKQFIANNGKDKKLSNNPQVANINFMSNKGTKYSAYIRVLDEIKAAYHELRAEAIGISLDDYLIFDEKKAMEDEKFIQKVKIFCQAINENFGQRTIKKYLDFDPKLDKNQIYLEAYQKARKSSPDTFLEKYYDVQRQFPMRISEGG